MSLARHERAFRVFRCERCRREITRRDAERTGYSGEIVIGSWVGKQATGVKE